MGWFPAGSDSWPLVVELLHARGEPWDYKLILDDLAWWADCEKMGRARRPGRPTLIKRWGVTERIARKALKDPAWRNRQRPADVQRMSSPRPADVQPPREPTPTIDEKSPADVQPASSECPADVHTRVDPPTPTPTPNTPPKKDTSGPKGPDPSAWDRLHALYQQHGGGKLRGRSKGMGLALSARLTEHGEEDVARVITWAATSQHKRAIFLREQGMTTLKTLMRASNFEEYLGFASQPAPLLRGELRPEPDFEEEDDPQDREELLQFMAEREAG